MNSTSEEIKGNSDLETCPQPTNDEELVQSKPSFVDNVVGREAFWILSFTSLLYLICYNTQVSFLSTFQIDASFVEISTKTLIKTSATILLMCVILWQTIGSFSFYSFRRVGGVFAFYYVYVVLFCISWVLYGRYGFAWGTVILAALLIIFLGAEIIAAVSHQIKGGKYWERVEKSLEHQAKLDDRTYRSKLLNKMSPSVTGIFVAFLFGAQLIGIIAGQFAASKNYFQLYSIFDEQYILIAEYGEGFVFAGIEDFNIDEQSATLRNETRWISLSDLSNTSLTKVTITTLIKTVTGDGKQSSDRVSFDEFVDRIYFWRDVTESTNDAPR